jgi:predicted metalloendopeptidase
LDQHEKLIINWYTAFLDSNGLQLKALQSLKADIEEVYRVKNKTDLARLMGEMNKGIAIAPLKFDVSPDYNDPRKLNLNLYTSPDYFSFYEVSFYKDPARAGLRKQHQEHISTMLEKIGLSHTAKSAITVQNLESKILTALETPQRNFTVPPTLYVSANEMVKKYPGFDWESFLDGAGIAANRDISIADENLLEKLLKVIASEPIQSWQEQLYVREARRMVGSTVMTQYHCEGLAVVQDPVGLAAYGMDSHHIQRYVTKKGFVKMKGMLRPMLRGLTRSVTEPAYPKKMNVKICWFRFV